MGQKIELKTTQFGKNVIFDLNRSLSGQDGETYHNIAHASLTNEISAQLAMKLFQFSNCLLYTSPSPRDGLLSRMPSSA